MYGDRQVDGEYIYIYIYTYGVTGWLQGGRSRGQGDRELRPYRISTGLRGVGLVEGV